VADPIETNEQIEEAASTWIARREGDTWNEDDQTTLDAWMRASTAHRVAFLRLHATWERLGRLSSLGTPVGIKLEEALGSESQATNAADETATTQSDVGSTPVRNRRSLRSPTTYAAAAALLLSCTAGLLWYLNGDHGSPYESAIGAITNATLSDGTTAVLDSNTRIIVSMNARERHVELERGGIFLSVAKDPARPFVVDVGDKRLTDEGTQFSVRRERYEVAVVVTDGKVHLATPSSPAAAQAHIEAGSQAHTSGTHIEVRPLSALEIQDVVSWHTGHLVFHDSSLPDAVAEFNRYSKKKMVIQSPSLADVRIGGSFRATDIDGFLSLLKRGFPVQVVETDAQITLARR
jgi:transmembrane sensor